MGLTSGAVTVTGLARTGASALLLGLAGAVAVLLGLILLRMVAVLRARQQLQR